MSDAAVLIVEDDANLREALFDTLSADSVPVPLIIIGGLALALLAAGGAALIARRLKARNE